MTSVWSGHPELVDGLADGIKERLSFSQIARRLGHGLSRNAVIGKAKRLGLCNEEPRSPRSSAVRTVRKIGERAKPLVLKPPVDAPLPMADEHGSPITVENATIHHCRYVYGDPCTKDFRYCGHAVLRRNFCDFHAEMCFDKSNPPRRAA